MKCVGFIFKVALNAVDVMITFCFHSSLDLSELAKAAKKKLQSVSRTSVLCSTVTVVWQILHFILQAGISALINC